MPTECSQDSFDFGTVEGRIVVGAFDGGRITSDAGALLLGQTNKAIGLVSQLAQCFQDGRDPDAVVHPLPALLCQRIVGIALGYEDINDHDQLRHEGWCPPVGPPSAATGVNAQPVLTQRAK